MAIKLVPITKTTYTIYNGVYNNQTLYLILDDGKLYAKYGLESSPDDFSLLTNNGFIWSINPLLTLKSINQVMKDIYEYTNVLWDMLDTEWDGYQWVGKFKNEDEADDLIATIQEFCDVDSEELEHFQIISPDQYGVVFGNLTPKDMRKFVASKSYIDAAILFEKDPYDFANYAIEFNANTADEYIDVISSTFQLFLDFVNNIDDVEYTNDENSTFIVSMYNDAIHFYADAISEPDNIAYITLLQYGNSYFNQIISLLNSNELFAESDLAEKYAQYIVDDIDATEYAKPTYDDYEEDNPEENELTDDTMDDQEIDIKTDKNVVSNSPFDILNSPPKIDTTTNNYINNANIEESATLPDDSYWKNETGSKPV